MGAEIGSNVDAEIRTDRKAERLICGVVGLVFVLMNIFFDQNMNEKEAKQRSWIQLDFVILLAVSHLEATSGSQ